ncbi:hypothetical protein GCM10007870_14700 [Gluconobacter kondonii]|uniref:Uncharacterized protein n=1 Tax=Gluconobacter kondonii TaxID=941463 RepID=A0ABQ5WR14_9PROT|nr:hypothetical protein AA3266_0994 [Gluconobacter kondonii NBRC 3266]GLQ65886.1 hypothetical protein GCM10007870_14700 [Gluconobacter kondonii]
MLGTLAAAQRAAQFDAAFARQHDVHDDEIDGCDFKRGPHLLPTGNTSCAEAAALKGTEDEGPHSGVIFDDEDTGGKIWVGKIWHHVFFHSLHRAGITSDKS